MALSTLGVGWQGHGRHHHHTVTYSGQEALMRDCYQQGNYSGDRLTQGQARVYQAGGRAVTCNGQLERDRRATEQPWCLSPDPNCEALQRFCLGLIFESGPHDGALGFWCSLNLQAILCLCLQSSGTVILGKGSLPTRRELDPVITEPGFLGASLIHPISFSAGTINESIHQARRAELALFAL